MRVHKASAKELESVREFTQACEAFLERERFSSKSPYEQWKDWDEDDKDKILVRKIVKEIVANEDIEEDDIDGRIIAYEYLRRRYSHRVGMVVMNADILIDNVCDPTKDYLDFHPMFYENHVAPEQ